MNLLHRSLPVALVLLAPAAAAQSLIISEYIEGSSNNKAIEILNTTAAPIDVAAAGLTIQLYFNGSATAGSTITPTGTVAAGDVFVVAHSSASATITAQADFTTSSLTFNGDDAVVVRTGGAGGPVVDVIGQVGFDPGTEWGTGVTSTADNTLVRKASACTGDSNPDDAFDPAVDYDGFATDHFADIGTYSGTCVAGGAATIVQFAGATGNAAEGDGTTSLDVTIANPSQSASTTFDVVFLSADPGTTGTGADIGGFTTVPVIAPAGASSASVTVPITDDADPEPTETFVFQIQNVAGGTNAGVGSQDRFTLSVSDNDTPVSDFVVINELDSDTPGSDVAEFIELFDGGAGLTSLDGLVVVLFNGSNDQSYAAYDLDGFSTDAAGLFVIGNAGVPGAQITIPGNTIQNGPDAVALYVGDATAFPNGTAPTTTNLLDAVVYGTNDPRNGSTLTALGQTIQYEEAYRATSDTRSIGRIDEPFDQPDFLGVPAYSGLHYALEPTPGALNPPLLTVDETAGVADLAGWRLLSTPLAGADQDFLQVGDYAPINLVQGVAAGTTHGPQYPAAGANLLNAYLGNGSFAAPANTDDVLPPGEGFFWYWYDVDLIPDDPTGTSRSYDLANPAFSFALTGIPVDDFLNGVAYGVALPASADGFYMIGNPFAYPYRAGGTTVDVGMLSSNFYLYDPSLGTYVVRVADFGDPYAGDVLPVWNGAMAEVSQLPGGTAFVPFNTPSAYVDPVSDDTFVGFAAAAGEGEARVLLTLDRVEETGAVPADRAAMLRFRADATLGWDRHDGSKPVPPQPAGLIAPVGERDGESRRQAVRSLPLEIGDRLDVPLAFLGTVDATWRLGAELAGSPRELSLHLTDHATGAVTDLRAGAYSFEAAAGDWSERFTLTVSQVVTAGAPEPGEVFLSVPAPNPSAGRTRLTLVAGTPQHVRADVFDALGRRVATVLDGAVAAGRPAELVVEAGVLAPGAYVVRVTGETFTETRRLTVVR